MTRPLFRPEPLLSVDKMKTYEISAPIGSHTRRARCEEVQCEANLKGWISVFDISTELGARQAKYVRELSRRTFKLREALPMIHLTFPPGQQCFAGHRVPLDRPAFFIVRDGDNRGNPTRRTVSLRPVDWVDDFATHQRRIADVHERG
jgi:hypothetical protein